MNPSSTITYTWPVLCRSSILNTPETKLLENFKGDINVQTKVDSYSVLEKKVVDYVVPKGSSRFYTVRE